jgi:uncharacterized protein YjbI with pentapeptide repeats
MADQSHLDILQQGVGAWNAWREEHKEPSQAFEEMSVEDHVEKFLSMNPVEVARFLTSSAPSRAPFTPFAAENYDVTPDLAGANLREANLPDVNLYGANLCRVHLSGANLRRANLRRADLTWADLSEANLTEMDCWEGNLREVHFSKADLTGARLASADLTWADLTWANLRETDLSWANFSGADLYGANLYGANLASANLTRARLTGADLSGARLSGADLTDANLTRCTLVKTELTGTTLTNCRIYGISAWDLQGEPRDQSNLVISPGDGNTFATVDDLEVAQFVYLLFDNKKLRNIIQTMTSKAVLILGNFAPERMEVLQAIRERLRDNGYLPILFDFEGPQNRNLIDTVTTVARLVRFVIADLTQPRSVPAELGAIVPAIESLPVQTLIEEPEEPYGMFSDLVERHSVLKVHHYKDLGHLLESFDDAVIAPAEEKFEELKEARVRAIKEKL